MRTAVRQSELIHDIRNRLTVVRANVEAFIDGKLPPTPSRLKAVLQSLTQLEQLLNDVRASQVETDAGARAVEVDICDVLEREYRVVEAIAAEKGIHLSVFRCPVKLAPCARFIGDPVRIGQIVSNVLLNALRYTPAGGEIRIDCTHEADRLQVSIADSGPGIAPAERDAIFQPGVRGAAGRGKPGSGFGLAIAKEYVEAQGGTIEVSSSALNGARFLVRLPGTVYANETAAAHCEHCAATRRSP